MKPSPIIPLTFFNPPSIPTFWVILAISTSGLFYQAHLSHELSFYGSNTGSNNKQMLRGAWVAQSVKRLPSAQVTIPGSRDRIPHLAPYPAGSPPLPPPALRGCDSQALGTVTRAGPVDDGQCLLSHLPPSWLPDPALPKAAGSEFPNGAGHQAQQHGPQPHGHVVST